MNINKVQQIDKPWGYEEILETNSGYTVKRLFMKKGAQCSLQYHRKKRETILALKGNLVVILNKGELVLKPGDFITIKPFERHRMFAKDENCLYLEASTSELNDVVRIKDDYGRK